MTTTATIHVFESAGLGRAPFRFVGFEVVVYQACPGAPVQSGSSCDYCGQGIRNVCWVEDADGKRFKVGPDCVLKTGDRGIVDPVKRAVNRAKREAKAKLDAARIARCRENMGRSEVEQAMRAAPHPSADSDMGTWVDGVHVLFSDLSVHSLWTWAEWMMSHAGTAGRIKVCRAVERVAS